MQVLSFQLNYSPISYIHQGALYLRTAITHLIGQIFQTLSNLFAYVKELVGWTRPIVKVQPEPGVQPILPLTQYHEIQRVAETHFDLLPMTFEPSRIQEKYRDVMCDPSLNLEADSGFHYLSPNEFHPVEIAPHLQVAPSGVGLVVGSERALSDMIHCDPNKTEAFFLLDIEPTIVAFNHFNLLLLRLVHPGSGIAPDYRELAARIPGPPTDPKWESIFQERVSAVRARLNEYSSIDTHLKTYYLEHLESFARIFYRQPRFWMEDPQCNEYRFRRAEDYSQRDDLCQRLHDCADRVVIVQKNINDRSWISDQIGWIDSSNVGDYAVIYPEPGARMIFAKGQSVKRHAHRFSKEEYGTEYYSYLEKTKLSIKEEEEFSSYIKRAKLFEPHMNEAQWLQHLYFYYTNDVFVDPMNRVEPASFSHARLEMLRTYFTECIYPVCSSFQLILKSEDIDLTSSQAHWLHERMDSAQLQELVQKDGQHLVLRLKCLLDFLCTNVFNPHSFWLRLIPFYLQLLMRSDANLLLKSWVQETHPDEVIALFQRLQKTEPGCPSQWPTFVASKGQELKEWCGCDLWAKISQNKP